jgi:endonuclease/exonuclease/phosphatase (EEP) superfamily protein YafD
VLIAPWAAWAIVRTFGFERGFPLAPAMAYTPYVAATALIPVVIALALRRWAAAAAAALVFASLLAAVAPRLAPDASAEDHGGPRFRVLSTNIRQGHADLRELVRLVRAERPDVLSIQELTSGAAARLRRLDLQRYLPHHEIEVSGGTAGAGIYSRFPMRRIETPQFRFRMPRGLIRLSDGTRVEIVCVHPFPPRRSSIDVWSKMLESLPSAPASGPLHVLAGDFNATLDHRELRRVLDRGYRDAGDALGQGLTPTWSSHGLLSLPITIDHVLVDERAGILDYSVHDLPGSDHNAIFAEVALGPERD